MNYAIANDKIKVGLTTDGGTFTSIRDSAGRERLWQPNPDVWTGQAPICFPICGGLRGGKATTLSGKKIELPRHGFASRREFSFVSQTGDSLVFKLDSDAETLAQYPFAFHFESRYQLKGNTVAVTFATTNTGDEPMPFFVGGHPGFKVPVGEGEDYSDYRVVFEKPETATVPLAVPKTGLIDEENRVKAPQDGDTLKLTHDLFSFAETIYDTLSSRSLTLENADGSIALRETFPDMPYLIIWSKPIGNFVALEPWGGLSTCSDEDDILEHKRGCLVAKPGETIERGYTIEVIG